MAPDPPGNSYDSDTLAKQLERTAILVDAPLKTGLVDLGYRRRDVGGMRILHRGKPKRMSEAEKRVLKRRQAVEPSIGHLKADHRMRGNFIKGVPADAMSPIPAAVFNIRWLMIFWRRILSPDLRLLDQHGSVVVLNVMLMSA